MLVTLIASLGGLLTSFVPEIIKRLEDKDNKTHELALLDRQMAAQQHQTVSAQDMQTTLAEARSQRQLYQTYQSGVPWVDALNGTVRPVLAYAFFLLYAFFKYQHYHLLEHLQLEGPAMLAHDALWSLEDQAIFASIIGFYFGHRAMQALRHPAPPHGPAFSLGKR